MSSSIVEIAKQIPGYDPWSDSDGFVFDEARAERPIGFFRDCLQHVKGEWAGQPFELEEWQQAVVANLFGWVDPATGTRRYRECFFFVPRKNGKSAVLAGICVYVMFCDGEPGAEIYSAAAERDQAALVFNVAKQMILKCPGLASRCTLLKHGISIEDQGVTYKAISSMTASKHGYNPHLSAIDELHVHKSGDLVDVLTTGTGARRQPITLYITTADYERVGSICNELEDYARNIRSGLFNDQRFLPVVYSADKEDDWTSEETWKKANPNYGISVKPEYLSRECEKAKRRPTRKNAFLQLHLNLRTEQAERYINTEDWDLCQAERPELEGERCYVGVDLSAVDDLSAVVLWFPDHSFLLPFFWCPTDRIIERTQTHKAPYQVWVEQGYIFGHDRPRNDSRDILKYIMDDIGTRYEITEVAVDPWNSLELQNALSEEGLDVVRFGQGYSAMNEPTKRLEELVATREIHHDGNPVMRWMAANLAVERDSSQNYRPAKKKSGDKIDGIVALIMALGRSMMDSHGSVYDERGIISV